MGLHFDVKTLQSAQSGNADGSTMYVARHDVAVMQVTGSFTGTVNFEATQDGTNWVVLFGINIATGSGAATTTAAAIFRFNVSGLERIRARTSSMSGGAVTVRARAMERTVA